MTKPLVIDGAWGEGGGQILRSALALSLVTGRPFRIVNIRARRPRPGLRNQHLAAVRAACAVGRAQVSGDAPGSLELEFQPNGCHPGNYTFDLGSAGSCVLVAQTVLPALIMAKGPSHLELIGGTHNPFAPPFHFLAHVFLPLLNRLGPQVSAELHTWGFYPAGGGRMSISVTPAGSLSPLSIVEVGEPLSVRLHAVVTGLPMHIAQRECRAFGRALNRPFTCVAEELTGAAGAGNVVMAELRTRRITELFSAFGRRGVPAEKVGRDVAEQVGAYLTNNAPVGPFLSDQLLIPAAMAGRALYRSGPPTRHTLTNRAIVERFLETTISLHPVSATVWEIGVGTL